MLLTEESDLSLVLSLCNAFQFVLIQFCVSFFDIHNKKISWVSKYSYTIFSLKGDFLRVWLILHLVNWTQNVRLGHISYVDNNTINLKPSLPAVCVPDSLLGAGWCGVRTILGPSLIPPIIGGGPCPMLKPPIMGGCPCAMFMPPIIGGGPWPMLICILWGTPCGPIAPVGETQQ